MSKHAVIQKLEKEQMKTDIPFFGIGDTISVHTRIIEGSKERTQIFTGTVIARKGYGISETFSLHRVAHGMGMERVFMLHSPRISKIEVVKEGKVRRGKLYYLRGKTGKKAKVAGRVGPSRRQQMASESAKPSVEEIEPIEEEKVEVNAAVEDTVAEKVETVEETTNASTETSEAESENKES